MKKLFTRTIIALFALGVVLAPSFGYAQTAEVEPMAERVVTIEVFERDDCGHCQDFFAFIDDISQERSDFEVISYDLYTPEGKEYFDYATQELRLVKGTPIIYLNETVIQGFDKPETTGQKIIAEIDRAKQREHVPTLQEFIDAGGEVGSSGNEGVCTEESCEVPQNEFLVTIPVIGTTIDVGQYSLPLMAAVLGTIDGFNPCAMWVLVLFLTALVAVGNKRKMIEVAGLFILAEAVMYYLILTVWLYAWDFIGLDQIVTPVVGVIAIGGGIFFLWEYYKSKDEGDACKVTNMEQRARISQKIQNFASKPLTIVTALGIIGLALSVNVIEFACSIGIPQAFTKILDLNNLTWLSKQLYNLIYIIGYMVDDLIVFAIAIFSFEKIGLTTKYSRISSLVGGILMLILGLILIFNPDWLVL